MRIIRLADSAGNRIVGFTNGFVSYGRRNWSQEYIIEFDWAFGNADQYIKIYKSTKRPWLRSIPLISALLAPFITIFLIPVSVIGIFVVYFGAAKRFFKDSVDQTSVRFFNWCNIVMMIVFLISFLITISTK